MFSCLAYFFLINLFFLVNFLHEAAPRVLSEKKANVRKAKVCKNCLKSDNYLSIAFGKCHEGLSLAQLGSAWLDLAQHSHKINISLEV